MIGGNTLDSYMFDNKMSEIPPEGITVKELNKDSLKSTLKDGKYIKEKGKVKAHFVTDGKYCASGPLNDLKVVPYDKCYELDETEPDVDKDKMVLSSTTNTVTVTLLEGIATDIESGIKEYRIIIFQNNKVIETKILKELGSYTFEKLKNKTEYKVEVIVVNKNDKESKSIVDTIETKDIINPVITMENTPSELQNGYLYKQVAKVVYTKGEIKNPEYFVKTSKAGISNINTIKVCGENTLPEECEEEQTKELKANTWYKVSGNVNVTYEKASSIGTIYAVTYDGKNLSGTTTGTLDKIDRTSPSAITVSSVDNNATSIKINYTGGSDSESGVSKYVCYWGTTTSLGSSKDLAADATSCTITTSTGTTYYYKICSVDKVGNPATCSSVGNVKTWTGIKAGTYAAGTAVTYAGQQWLVVKDNGGTTTLISKNNIGTGNNYSGAVTSVNNYVNNNAVMAYDLNQKKLTGQGLPSKTQMPANGSGTPFWTSTVGGSGYYILGVNGSTAGYSYTKYALSATTRYYASGIGAYSSKGLNTGRTSSTAVVNSAAATATAITLEDSISGTATDTIYTTTSTQAGTWTYTGSGARLRTYTLVLNLIVKDSSKSKYNGYVAGDREYTIPAGSSSFTPTTTSNPKSITYCNQTSGAINGTKTLTSTSPAQIITTTQGGVQCQDAAITLGKCTGDTTCASGPCSTTAKAKATFIEYYNYKKETKDPGDWTTDHYTYNTTAGTGCVKASYYTLSDGSVSIGTRAVITVQEREE